MYFFFVLFIGVAVATFWWFIAVSARFQFHPFQPAQDFEHPEYDTCFTLMAFGWLIGRSCFSLFEAKHCPRGKSCSMASIRIDGFPDALDSCQRYYPSGPVLEA